MPIPHRPPPVNKEVLDALYNIRTTPYFSSFLYRLQGVHTCFGSGLIACDWQKRPLWVELMNDIQDHFALRQYVWSCENRVYILTRPLAALMPGMLWSMMPLLSFQLYGRITCHKFMNS